MNILLFFAFWAVCTVWVVGFCTEKLVNLPKDWATITASALLALCLAFCLFVIAEIF
jgi:hypothetical protein|nr:MAG TPA: hypothetical protein [Caudoviricetes sp.]